MRTTASFASHFSNCQHVFVGDTEIIYPIASPGRHSCRGMSLARSRIRMPHRAILGLMAVLAAAPAAAQEGATLCDAYGAADVVFVGVAGERVRRPMKQWDGSVVMVTARAMSVERAHRRRR